MPFLRSGSKLKTRNSGRIRVGFYRKAANLICSLDLLAEVAVQARTALSLKQGILQGI